MAQIKHIAIATQDAAKTASFYKDVFGLREIAKLESANANGFFLSDGNVNMAILDFQNDAVAGVQGKEYSGIHHIGFEVEDLEDVEKKLAANNSAPMEETTRIRFGAVSQPKAVDSSPSRRMDTALRNLALGSTKATHKSKRTLTQGIVTEVLKAADGDVASFAVGKREELERVAASAR